MSLPDLASIERHWLAGLSILVLGHGVGHGSVDLGVGGLGITVGGWLALVAGLRLYWLQGRLLDATNDQRRLWLRRIDGRRPPVQNAGAQLPQRSTATWSCRALASVRSSTLRLPSEALRRSSDGVVMTWGEVGFSIAYFGPTVAIFLWRNRVWGRLVDARARAAASANALDEIRAARASLDMVGVMRLQWRERRRLEVPEPDPSVERLRLRVRLVDRLLILWIVLGVFPLAAVLSLPSSIAAVLDGRPTPNLVPALVVLVATHLSSATSVDPAFGQGTDRTGRPATTSQHVLGVSPGREHPCAARMALPSSAQRPYERLRGVDPEKGGDDGEDGRAARDDSR